MNVLLKLVGPEASMDLFSVLHSIFAGELVERIHADIEIARKGLEDDDMQHFATDEVFVRR